MPDIERGGQITAAKETRIIAGDVVAKAGRRFRRKGANRARSADRQSAGCDQQTIQKVSS